MYEIYLGVLFDLKIKKKKMYIVLIIVMMLIVEKLYFLF